MIISTGTPVKILSGKYGSRKVVLQNRNAGGGSSLFFGSQPNQLRTAGTLLVAQGTTNQLDIDDDLWVLADTADVDLQVIL